MCLKANKTSLTMMWQETEATYLTLKTWDKRNKELIEDEQRREDYLNRELKLMKEQRESIEDTIRSCVDETTAKKLYRYDKVAKAFGKFFGQEEL